MRLTHLALAIALCVNLACERPREGSGMVEAWVIIPLDTIGGAETGPASFSDIRGLVVDAQQRLLVLEHASQQIEMFDSSGNHLRTIGRKGAGPGEFVDANGLIRAPDGSLWVNDPGNNRFTVFDAEGAYLKSVTVDISGYGYIWEGWFTSDGTLLEPIHVRRDTSSVERLQRFRAMGTKVDTLPIPCVGMIPVPTRKNSFIFEYKQGMTMWPVPFTVSRIREYDQQGHAWCGNTGEYTLRRVGIEGGDTVTLTGHREALPVSAAELEAAKDQIRKGIAKLPVYEPDWSRIPKVKPIIQHLFMDDVGRPWVQVEAPGSAQTWDVFDESGKQVATVASKVRFSTGWPIVVLGDRFYGVASDENDVAVIVRARIRR